MEDDDDFTFPTVAAAAPAAVPGGGRLGGRDDGDPVVALQLQLPLPADAAAASPLWPFAASPTKANADGDAPVSASDGREGEQRAEAADEERMDMLWEGAATTTAPSPQSAGSGAEHAEPPPPTNYPKHRRAETEDEMLRAANVTDAERMDKLWESFNEELLLRRALSKAAAAADRPGGGAARPPGLLDPGDRWYLCNYAPSDAESEETTSASSPAGYGCAPTMLRASSRAGGAGQFCSSPRGRRRGAAAGWALLLRLFRRLFAVEKAPASSRSHASVYVP